MQLGCEKNNSEQYSVSILLAIAALHAAALAVSSGEFVGGKDVGATVINNSGGTVWIQVNNDAGNAEVAHGGRFNVYKQQDHICQQFDASCPMIAVKLRRNASKSDPTLIAEYGVSAFNGETLWFNWSKNGGNPFLDKRRTLQASCRTLSCNPGDESCADPVLASCSPNSGWLNIQIG